MRNFTFNRFAFLAIMIIASVSLQAQTNAAEMPTVTAKSTVAGSITEEAAASAIKVKTFPNPYIDRITFSITSPVSGKGILEIYDLTGRRLDLVYQGEFQAGVTKNVEYRVNLAPRTPIMYKFGVGLKTATSILIRFN